MFLSFSLKCPFYKTTARNRAPPKQSHVTSFMTSTCETFYIIIAFWKLTGTQLFNFIHNLLEMCSFTKSRWSLCHSLTTTPVLQRPVNFQPFSGRPTLRVESYYMQKLYFSFFYLFLKVTLRKQRRVIEHLQNKFFLPHL